MSGRGPSGPATIAVIGTGTVGLTTAAGLALLGHHVTAVDLDAGRIDALARGESLLDEPGLPNAIAEGAAAGRLMFSTDGPMAVRRSDVVFLCMPPTTETASPPRAMELLHVATQLGRCLRPGSIVVNRTAVGVGVAQQIEAAIARDDVAVVVNPDFVRSGTALRDFLRPDRIVVGAASADAGRRVAALYDPIETQVIVCGTAAAETIRYASTAFVATKVALANSISELCAAVDADAVEVLAGVGLDQRIGEHSLTPGPGFGGTCFGDDARALLSMSRSVGLELPIVDAAIRSNASHMAWVTDRVTQFVGRPLSGLRVAVWGLAATAGTDDLGDSPALHVVHMLRSRGADVAAYDPRVPVGSSDGRLEGIELCGNPYSPCVDAAVLVVLTDWPEYAQADLTKVASLLGRPQVFDARLVLDPERTRDAGLRMAAVGR